MTPLSPRQKQIVHLLARGYDDAEITAELGITARTVKSHCDTIRAKLGIKTRHKIPSGYRTLTGLDPWEEL